MKHMLKRVHNDVWVESPLFFKIFCKTWATIWTAIITYSIVFDIVKGA